ncbi:MAG: hypothetical protein WAK26_14900 [Terracidiphilus sp.]
MHKLPLSSNYCGIGIGVVGAERAICGTGIGVVGAERAICGIGIGVVGAERAICGIGAGVIGAEKAICGIGAGVIGAAITNEAAETSRMAVKEKRTEFLTGDSSFLRIIAHD